MDETCAAILPRVVDAVRACKGPPVRRDFGTQQLQTVRLDKRALGNLLHCFTNLRELHLAGLAPIGDSLLGMINHAPSASAIHFLTLQGASLTYWAKALTLPQLQSLRILGGSIRGSLDLLFGKATKLKLLSIAQCSSLRDDQLRMILGRLDPTLTDLSLRQCLRVRRPTIELTRLERLSFMGCFALTEVPSFFCPAVRELNLFFCFRLGTDQIQFMVDSLPRLETLTLVKCPLLEYLVIDSPTLRVLNVNYCSALRGIKLSCPALQRMENFACISLCQLTMESADALEYLELSGLPISRLELTSRRLAHLELENCRRLDHCIIRCPALQRVNLIGSRMVALRFCKEVRSVMMQNWTWVPLDSTTMAEE